MELFSFQNLLSMGQFNCKMCQCFTWPLQELVKYLIFFLKNKPNSLKPSLIQRSYQGASQSAGVPIYLKITLTLEQLMQVPEVIFTSNLQVVHWQNLSQITFKN